MDVRTSTKAQALKSALAAHKEQTERLHGDLSDFARGLDPREAARLHAVVAKHSTAYDAFSDDAQAVVGPTGRRDFRGPDPDAVVGPTGRKH